MSEAMRDPVVVVAYDPEWPRLFERQRVPVTEALRGWLVGAVEHLGSTAVPGMPAKPIVDMLARVTDHGAAEAIVPAMAGIGWVHAPEPHDERLRRLGVSKSR